MKGRKHGMCFVCLCVCVWRFVRHTLRETVFGGFFSFQKPSRTPTQFGVCVCFPPIFVQNQNRLLLAVPVVEKQKWGNFFGWWKHCLTLTEHHNPCGAIVWLANWKPEYISNTIHKPLDSFDSCSIIHYTFVTEYDDTIFFTIFLI